MERLPQELIEKIASYGYNFRLLKKEWSYMNPNIIINDCYVLSYCIVSNNKVYVKHIKFYQKQMRRISLHKYITHDYLDCYFDEDNLHIRDNIIFEYLVNEIYFLVVFRIEPFYNFFVRGIVNWASFSVIDYPTKNKRITLYPVYENGGVFEYDYKCAISKNPLYILRYDGTYCKRRSNIIPDHEKIITRY